MKFTKLSLVAAMLIGSSAFALENTKVSGDANLYYSTTDATDTSALNRGNGSLFDEQSSYADASVNLNVTTDVLKSDMVSVSAGAGYTFLSTLGLENNLVGNVWGGAHTATAGTGASYASVVGGAKVENASWMNEAWIAATAGNTTAKLGRMELDTPLAFTEKWTIEKNTFEAIVAINTDIPDTTLVGAYVGNGNGNETFGQNLQGPLGAGTLGLAAGAVVNANGEFGTYGTDGAYAIGAINNSFKPLTLQAWYYNVSRAATAYWLQADYISEAVPGLMAGLQYNVMSLDAPGAKDDKVAAVMLGYEVKDMLTAKIAYSKVNSNGSIGYAGFNTATNLNSAQSKLYTEAWWNYGKVTQAGTNSYNITLESPVNGMVDLGLYYTSADQSDVAGNNDLSEVTLTAGKSCGPLNATLAYIYADIQDNIATTDDASSTVQAYLTVNF